MVDSAAAGSPIELPVPQLRRAVDTQLARHASPRLASAFLLAYSLCDPDWGCEHIPTGIRGKYGDKLLASGLSERNVTLHDNITAFGENLGWKGNVHQVRLSMDDRFKDFIKEVQRADETQRRAALSYFAGKFADSIRVQQPLLSWHLTCSHSQRRGRFLRTYPRCRLRGTFSSSSSLHCFKHTAHVSDTRSERTIRMHPMPTMQQPETWKSFAGLILSPPTR